VDLREITNALTGMPESDKAAVVEAALQVTGEQPWVPNPGPQTDAWYCEADELFYGGQAGGGKTNLLLGLACTEHQRSLILRRTNSEAGDLCEDLFEIIGRDGWSGQKNTMRMAFMEGMQQKERLIKIGGCQHEKDKQGYKGRPRDLYGFDEISDFTETMYVFITGWNRSTDPNQRCRVIATGNPPTTPEGLWVIKRWAAWLDPTHSNPAKPGELRWYTTDTEKDEEIEVDGPGPHLINGEEIIARSRTFIPAELEDNPDLRDTNYDATLASLPAELREAYRDGKFNTTLRDKPFQVIPTAWIKEAQARWEPKGYADFLMTALAFDPAGGGEDPAVLATRYGGWYDHLKDEQGKITVDGSKMAAFVITNRRHACAVVLDAGGGYAGATSERLKDNDIPFRLFNGAETTTAKTIEGNLKFYNKRAMVYWRFREALDPDQEGGSPIALPPDAELVAELAAHTWQLTPKGIKVNPKEDVKKVIGRSPGKADTVTLCLTEGDAMIRQAIGRKQGMPKVNVGHRTMKRTRR
jgi:hypothetical protein